MAKKPEFYPAIGEHLFLSQHTGDYYVDLVKIPYTVVDYDSRKHLVYVQRCKLIFNGPIYYDTVADDIEADPTAEIELLTWADNKRYHGWVKKSYPNDTYPYVAHFGEWKHQPYLN